jgi:CheY-like chemotaxis protein
MKQRLLVVEDEEPLRRVLVRNLEARGHEVVGAATAAEALAALAHGNVDLMFLDIDLPDRTGWEVVRELQAQGRAVPFVVISAIRIAPQQLAEFKPAAYLPKPFPLEALLRLAEGDWKAEETTGDTVPGKPFDAALSAYDARLDAERTRASEEAVARASQEQADAAFDEQFAQTRVLVIEPALHALQARLVAHGHRTDVNEEERVEAAPGWTRGARVTLTLQPKGWDFGSAHHNLRPHISFAANPADRTVEVRCWIAKPGRPGEGGQRAVYAIDDLTADAVDQELDRFVSDVLGSTYLDESRTEGGSGA